MLRLSALLLSLAILSGCNLSGGANTSTTSKGTGDTSGTSTGSTSTSCSSLATGVGTTLGGFVPFPATNAWNTDISAAAVDPNSTTIINSIGTTTAVHADFGAGLFNGSKIGIPYVVVD